jgi:hypothetical protein
VAPPESNKQGRIRTANGFASTHPGTPLAAPAAYTVLRLFPLKFDFLEDLLLKSGEEICDD